MINISKVIAEKTGYTDLVSGLNASLTGSELNTFLLELFKQRAKKIVPAELLKDFEKNRFTAPAKINTIDFQEFELWCLKQMKHKGFLPVTLSPLTAFASCSAVGFVDQNNVMTALRGTEVVSDATNVFALLIASEFKKKKGNSLTKYVTSHRHVRSQAFSNPAFTSHFSILCLATGGLDTGSYTFELEQLSDHMTAHLSILSNEFGYENLSLVIYLKDDNKTLHQKVEAVLKKINGLASIKIENQINAGDYYKLIQFKFFLAHNGEQVNLSDGGLVDWTQKLIPNKKHRLIISAVGTELIHKIKDKQI